MANEDKKDFNAMLMDSKDMPKVQIITDEKSIEKWILINFFKFAFMYNLDIDYYEILHVNS